MTSIKQISGNRSKFEPVFAQAFEVFKMYVKKTDFKFYVLTICNNWDAKLIAEFNSFGQASGVMLETSRSLQQDPSVDAYYVGMWQRHKDGTCHRVCYAEHV